MNNSKEMPLDTGERIMLRGEVYSLTRALAIIRRYLNLQGKLLGQWHVAPTLDHEQQFRTDNFVCVACEYKMYGKTMESAISAMLEFLHNKHEENERVQALKTAEMPRIELRDQVIAEIIGNLVTWILRNSAALSDARDDRSFKLVEKGLLELYNIDVTESR